MSRDYQSCTELLTLYFVIDLIARGRTYVIQDFKILSDIVVCIKYHIQ